MIYFGNPQTVYNEPKLITTTNLSINDYVPYKTKVRTKIFGKLFINIPEPNRCISIQSLYPMYKIQEMCYGDCRV